MRKYEAIGRKIKEKTVCKNLTMYATEEMLYII